MTPSISESDFRNHGLADSVLPRHLSLRDSNRGFDRYDFFIGKLGPTRFFSSERHVPALCDHVNRIGLVASCPEVGRVYAKPDIAGMAHAKPIWDWSVGENPREPVRLPRLPVELEGSIPVTVLACGPKPTVVRSAFFDLRPEAFGKVSISHDDLLSVAVVRVRSESEHSLRPANSNT